MSKDTRGKTVLFIKISASLIFLVFVISEALTIHRAHIALEEYRAAGERPLISGAYLSALETRLKELREEEARVPRAEADQETMADTVAAVRGLLRNKNIEVERFRVTGKEPEESVEFIIHGNPIPFLRFLMDVSENPGISLSYINIKPNQQAGIDAVMRFIP
jgi:hypothetical protein